MNESVYYIEKFVDLLKGELGEDKVLYDGGKEIEIIGVGKLSTENIADCYNRTKQEVLFECLKGINELDVSDNDAEIISKITSLIKHLISNTTNV